MRSLLRRFARDERGVAAILGAFTIGICISMSAFAVDFGYHYLQSRKLQGIADLAALAAANDIDNAAKAARRVVAENGWEDPVEIVVEIGSYTPDPSLDEFRRFQPGRTPRNAARVTLKSSTQLFFGKVISDSESLRVERSATAASAELAAFTMGTRLASVNGGIANALLSALTGGKVNLSVMDYQGLVNADIDLIAYVAALRTHLRLSGDTLAEVLNETIDRDEALEVAAKMLADRGDRRAASALQHIANASRGELELTGLLDLGVYGRQDQVSSQTTIMVSALDLANGVLTVGGTRDLKLDLAASIPKLAGLKVWLAIGERPNESPWLTVSSGGEPELHTAQMRLYALAEIAPGGGLLAAAGIKALQLPLIVELASAEGRLARIACGRPGEIGAVVQVKPSVGHTSIATIDPAKLDNFTRRLDEKPAMLVGTPLVSVTAQARIDVGGNTWKSLEFNAADIKARKVKTAQTTDIVGSLVASLLTRVNLKVELLGGGLGLGGLDGAIAKTLTNVAAPLDDTLNAITDLLGLHLGEVDVWVTGVRCRRPALVL